MCLQMTQNSAKRSKNIYKNMEGVTKMKKNLLVILSVLWNKKKRFNLTDNSFVLKMEDKITRRECRSYSFN